MILGVTGSQNGPTKRQKDALFTLLWNLGPANQLHHGDCIGVDAIASKFARCFGMKTYKHPPLDVAKRAFCDDDVDLPPKEYLARNHDIVNVCHLLIAVPKTSVEVMRSGTWATIRYARRVGRETLIIDP